MKETPFQQKLIKYLNSLDETYCFKVHQNIYGSGLPDILGCYQGKFIGIECKVITCPKRDSTLIKPNVSDLQLAILRRIVKAKGYGLIATLLNPTKKIFWHVVQPHKIKLEPFTQDHVFQSELPSELNFLPERI